MSRRLNNATHEELPETELDMSPMIDMVFLLIIFFMVTAKIIKYKLDPKVKIPIGSNAQRSKDPVPTRIVINVYEDGTIKDELGDVLADSDAIFDYITAKKKDIPSPTGKYQIFLRGDTKAVVKEFKRIIKAAGSAGVPDIVFASYPLQR